MALRKQTKAFFFKKKFYRPLCCFRPMSAQIYQQIRKKKKNSNKTKENKTKTISTGNKGGENNELL